MWVTFGMFASLASAACWASASLLFARLGLSTHPAVMNLLKCSIALVLMVLTLGVGGWPLWPPTLDARALALLAGSGVLGLAVGDTLYFQALVRLGPRRTLLLTSLVPPMAATLAWAALGESLPLLALPGMALTIGGVTWVVLERAPSPPPASVDAAVARPPVAGLAVGLAFGLGAAVCQATGQVFTRAAATGLGALELSVVRLSFGVLGVLLHLVWMGRLHEVPRPLAQPRTRMLLLTATLLGTYAGVWLMNLGLVHSPVGLASTLNSTSPLFVLPLTVLLLGERVTVRAWLGALVAVAGIAWLTLSRG
jgi:drug/metabolite transporter (DMT)-like permease